MTIHSTTYCIMFFCLTFIIHIYNQVDIVANSNVQNLWNVTDRMTKKWTKAQMQLPPLGDAVIKFTVIRQERVVHSYYKPHLALDDIEITNGICPDFGKKNIDILFSMYKALKK